MNICCGSIKNKWMTDDRTASGKNAKFNFKQGSELG